MNPGGAKPSSTAITPSRGVRRASAAPTRAKPLQYSAAPSSSMPRAPGATGSISRHSHAITGDCQSP
ncbi:hypothetical protein PQJ73_10015 [Rhodoplanes tepidamans]|uniref:Uncharacterized protein n=1 Tax=Rhodoplanes tepidamans TaxID=200616 RepID=A0ABT5J8P6_RHOTP|nr:hypothetical protein [Rhodoplanes tepidamans]MDC7786015.1 hypothetical protein [Rhodoplanes tepidamans]